MEQKLDIKNCSYHNTLASHRQTTDRRQHFMTIAELAMQLQCFANNFLDGF